ncbi:hypothetical protein HAZT_HAZT007441 [Hyalella azteca]|uniref:Uncharacterized protein n=1 Tax=Hyalella azteca TaxID=294128 RepID=A0A6A0H2B6_HYAAZ|nr:hypothetical protein HAZT_HAZT007441 [Hyalella azteca]
MGYSLFLWQSCLIKRYCEQRFVARYIPTIGIDYGSTRVEVDDQVVSVHFFDTSGSPLFEEVRSEFYADMQGVLLVYDVTDQASFLALDSWMAELHHNLGQLVHYSKVAVFMILVSEYLMIVE